MDVDRRRSKPRDSLSYRLCAPRSIVTVSGFPFYETGNSPDYSAPGAPTDVVLRQGDVSGQIGARSRPKRTPSMNEVQTCTGDPNLEANWKTVGMFSGGKATLNDFAPGTTVWVRERSAGLRGIMGDWSVPAVRAISAEMLRQVEDSHRVF